MALLRTVVKCFGCGSVWYANHLKCFGYTSFGTDLGKDKNTSIESVTGDNVLHYGKKIVNEQPFQARERSKCVLYSWHGVLVVGS